MKYVDALDKLLMYRQEMMSKPPKDRRLKIYHKKYEQKNVQGALVNLESEFSASDDQIVANYWKDIVRMNRNGMGFQSKRKLEFEHLLKQKTYKEAVIRVKLPNELIIEAVFGPL